MSAGIVAEKQFSVQTFANNALKAAGRTWFVVAVLGQLMFMYYIASFYGGSAVKGDIGAWNKILTHGYIRGDTAGNFAVASHLFLAAYLMIGAATQLIPQIRKRMPKVHHWNGRLFMFAAFTTSVMGLYMIWIRGSSGDIGQHLGLTINALLIMLCTVLALRYALARKFGAHRRWALRLFMVVSGVWFFRVGLMLWLFLNHGPAGFDPKTFTGPFLTFLSFAQYLLPLAVLELYLRARDSATAPGRIAVAAGVFLLTAGTGLGIFVATVRLWLPYL